MIKRPLPIPLAMTICDMVIEDKITSKKSLIGLFDNITAPKIPSIHPRLSVFISLTEGNGEFKGSLKCVSADENKILSELSGPIVFKNPHQIIEFNFELCGLPLTRYGDYRFDFYCNDELLISRKFKVSAPKT